MDSAAETSVRPPGRARSITTTRATRSAARSCRTSRSRIQTNSTYNTSVAIADSTTSAGTIVLASTHCGDRSRQIVSQGTFSNLAGGVQANGGNGGTRYLDGHIVSQGTISIGSGANVITEQGGQVDQQGGTVNVPGYWELDKSTYNFSAGGTSVRRW